VYTVVRVVVKVMVPDEEAVVALEELEAAAEELGDEDEVGAADEDDGEVIV